MNGSASISFICHHSDEFCGRRKKNLIINLIVNSIPALAKKCDTHDSPIGRSFYEKGPLCALHINFGWYKGVLCKFTFLRLILYIYFAGFHKILRGGNAYRIVKATFLAVAE